MSPRAPWAATAAICSFLVAAPLAGISVRADDDGQTAAPSEGADQNAGAAQGEGADPGAGAPSEGADQNAGAAQGEGADQNPGAQAQAAPVAAPDPAFLNLPAYDVEPLSGGPLRVGDLVPLKIIGAGAIFAADGLRLAVPAGMDPGVLLDQGLDIPALTDEKSRLEKLATDLKFPVIAAKPGQLAVPSLAIADPSGKPVARTNPFSLQVQSAIGPNDKAPKESAPPRPPVMLSFPWIVIAALVFLGCLALGGIIYGIVRFSRRKRAVIEPRVPAVPPKSEDEIALAALGELERQGLMSKGQYKRHYFQVSETLKAYFAARYRVDARESTTREMLAMLEHTAIPPESVRELGGVFTKLDFVKFTDHVPENEEGAELLARARALVLRTRKAALAPSPILPARQEAPRAL